MYNSGYRSLTAYFCPESRYRKSNDLAPRLMEAARYLLAAQQPDGTVDLYTTNFHSSPDTGFVLEKGMGRYTAGGDTIEFGPGETSHRWTQLRGALPKLDGLSVYITALTPFEKTLRIS